MQILLPEVVNLFPGFIPVNMQAAPNTSLDRIDMSRYQQCAICVYKGKGAAAEPAVITVLQYNAKSGGSNKALGLKNGVYYKAHADLETIAGWTKTAEDSADGGVYTGTPLVEMEGFIVIPVMAGDLDTSNGYRWMAASIASPGAQPQLGCMFYAMLGSRWTPVQDAMIP